MRVFDQSIFVLWKLKYVYVYDFDHDNIIITLQSHASPPPPSSYRRRTGTYFAAAWRQCEGGVLPFLSVMNPNFTTTPPRAVVVCELWPKLE